MILACNSRFIPIAMREVFHWGLYRRLPVGVMIINCAAVHEGAFVLAVGCVVIFDFGEVVDLAM